MARIFIVDDENHIREWYSHELSLQGHKVTSMESSRDLINKVEMFQADLIILDIGLVGSDDLKKLHQIRKTHRKSPVIIWTANHSFELENREPPLDYFLVKAYDTAELNSKIRSALGTNASFRNKPVV